MNILYCVPNTKKLEETDAVLSGAFAKRANVRLVDPTRISYVLEDQRIGVYHEDEDLSDADAMIIRRIGYAPTEIFHLAMLVEHFGALVLDSPRHLLPAAGKLLTHLSRKEHHVPVPDSIFCPALTPVAFDEIKADGLKLPWIVKPQNGRKSEGVELVRNKKEAASYRKRWPDSPVIVQPFLDIVHEYRVFIIDGTSLGICEKIADSHVRSAALDSEFVYERNPRVEAFALAAIKLGSSHIYGVDVAETSDGKLYILEANRSPGFLAFRKASGLPIEDLMVDFYLGCVQEHLTTKSSLRRRAKAWLGFKG